MLKYCQSSKLTAIDFSIDTGVLITIIGFIIAASTYMAVLSYKVHQLQNHPLFVAFKDFQKEQVVDFLKNLYREREN